MESRIYQSLTHPQKRIWYTEKTYFGTPFACLANSVRYRRETKPETLERAIRALVANHEGLRLRLVEGTGGAEDMQYASDSVPEKIDQIDFSGNGGAERCEAWIGENAAAPFKLYDSPLYYFAIIHFGDDGSGFSAAGYYFKLHHLVSDGWTIALIYSQILEYCEAIEAGREAEILTEKPYSDYLGQEKNYLAAPQFEDDEKYWMAEFEAPLDEAVIHFRRQSADSIKAKRVVMRFPGDVRESMHKYRQEHQTTIYKLVTSAFFIYAARVTQSSDIAVTTAVHGRTREFRKTAGMFVGTAPVRAKVLPEKSFTEFVADIGTRFEGVIRKRAAYPFDILINRLRERKNANADILLAAAGVIGHPDDENADIRFRNHFQGCDPAPLVLHVNIHGLDARGTLEVAFDYQTDLFTEDDVRTIFESMVSILRDGTADGSRAVGELSMITEAAAARLLTEFNPAPSPFAVGGTLAGMFAESARKHSKKTAIVCGDSKMTYAALDESAGRLAATLADNGVKPETICAVYAGRSNEYVVAILAILRAGGAYLPLDVSCPADRIGFMLADAGVAAVLTLEKYAALFSSDTKLIFIDDEASYDSKRSVSDSCAGPENLAYVIYTSGSTGKPKGVMIENRSAVNMIEWSIRHYGMDAGDRCAHFASFSFDAAVPQMFSPLCSGAELHILSDELRYSPAAANGYFEERGITYADLPTQFFEIFAREQVNRTLRHVTTGGEKLKAVPPGSRFRLTDEYGPTECTVTATYYDYDGRYEKTPIGRPLPNVRIYILDRRDRLVPAGTPGELCIAGACLARGYLNRPELTAEKFAADPFRPGERMYRTGDLARWLPDGNIDYMGRIDFQVKIRGFRVELGEIEAEIGKHPAVSEAVVLDSKNAAGEVTLSAHVVLKKDGALDAAGLKEFAARALPNYMVPARIAFVSRIPLNSSGKVDKKALLAELPVEAGPGLVPPSTETEKALADIWKEHFGLGEIGVNQDYFELGGHSLKAVSLQSAIQKRFGTGVSLKDIFDNPTIKKLAAAVGRNAKKAGARVSRAPERKHYPLSAAQKRLFVMERLSGGTTTYNLTLAFDIRGPLDAAGFGQALATAVERHSSLATRFDEIAGEPVAVIEKNLKFRRNYIEAPEESVDGLIRDFVRPFDLSRAPLFRTLLIKCRPDQHVFVLDAHHIIFDGISAGVFMREICAIYDGRAPEAAGLDYQDYAVWQNESAGAKEGDAEKERYWLDAFKKEVPLLELPTDRPRGTGGSYSGSRIFLDASGLSNDLDALAARCSTTGFSTALALFFALLNKYTGQNDIVAGVPAAGREMPEFQDTVGMFVNTLAVRAYPGENKSFAAFAGEVKDTFVQALDNQGYQFDRLVEKLGVKRTPGRNPLFDVMFAYEETGGAGLSAKAVSISDRRLDAGIAKFDLTLFVFRGNGRLELAVEYRDSLFEKATAERFLRNFAALLKNAAADPAAAIGAIEAMDEGDRARLMKDFNSTAAPYPADTNLVELFEKKAAERPGACALMCDGRTMTYSELDAKANRLARRLVETSGGEKAIFGILLDRSFEMVVSILAVLKAGGAYLPIDPSYPAERIEYVISDSGIKTLLTEKKHIKAAAFAHNIIDVYEPPSYSDDATATGVKICCDDLIYIIYTSGSTGRPKGVMVKHRGALNYIWWCKKVYTEEGSADFPLYSSISFDLTVTSIFTPLICGAKIVIYGEREKETLIDRIIADDLVDIVKLTPTHLQIIEGMRVNCRKIKKFIVGGEDLKASLAAKITRKFPGGIRIFNEYGPTETTVGCMIYEFDPARAASFSVPIGVPAANTKIYILGKDMKPVMPGATGEIYISGDGVARGYLNKAELTASKFIADPFDPGKTMYRSGDLARMLPGWNIEFLGRVDDQIKLRGFRIETGEIEAALAAHPAVREAAVVLRDGGEAGRYLCAYYTAAGVAAPDPKELKAHLGKRLPQYFIPDAFMKLDAIPVTANGKLDRRALPDPRECMPAAREYAEPRNDAERAVAAVWAEVLAVARVGIDDNFFELGGHSLKAVKAAMRLAGDFEISVNDIFEHQSVRALAAAMKPVAGNLRSRLESLRRYDPKPAEPADDSAARKLREYRESAGAGFKKSSRRAPYGDIFLTGSTGYLGAHILNELLEKGRARLHLLVRAKSLEEALSRVRERYGFYFGPGALEKHAGRISAYPGDLSKDRFALEAEIYARLSECVDCVINSAADVRHFGHYQQFYEANVASVENIVTFAKTGRRKDVNHVSTMSVASGDIEGVPSVVFCEDDIDIGQNLTNYYLKTKLLAEKTAVAARADGISVNIFRAGNLAFNSKTGRCQSNIEENAFFKIVRSLVTLGVVPDSGDEAEFSFIDSAARAITVLFDRYEDSIFHILNPEPVKLSRLLSAPETGLDIRVSEFGAFVREMIGYCEDPVFRPFIDDLLLHRDWADEMASRTKYLTLSERTAAALRAEGFEWPGVSGGKCFEMLAAALRGRVEYLAAHPLFASVPLDSIRRAALLTRELHYRDGETIAWENEPAAGAHIVTSGAVELAKHSRNMWTGTIGVLGKDELLGFESALSNGISSVIAEAVMGPACTLFISNANLRRLVASEPAFALNAAAGLARKIIAAQGIIVNIG